MRHTNVHGVRHVGYFTVWIFLVVTLYGRVSCSQWFEGSCHSQWSALLHCVGVAVVSNLSMETSVLTEQPSWNLSWEPGGRGAQILSGSLLWQLSYIQRHLMFAPCHSSGTWNFEVAPTFLENTLHPCPVVLCTFDGTQMFITMFTRSHHLFVSWARSILSIPLHLVSVRCHLCKLSALTGLHF